MAKRVCVVIPAYNVERTLGSLLVQLETYGVDVIVVDDGSTDRTATIARAGGAPLIRHPANQGKGQSLRDGFAWGVGRGYEALVTMDGDGQHLPSELPHLVAALDQDGVGVVVGNRMGNPRSMPWLRQITNAILSAWISRFCGQWVPDSQCGFRAVRREVLARVALTTERYEIESELLIKAARAGYRIASVPITTVYRHEKSRVHPIADTLRFFRFLRTLK